MKQSQPTELAVVEHGKVPPATLAKIHDTSETAFHTFEANPARYQELVANPMHATTNAEKVGIMAAREIFLIVDKSGSMSGSDTNPTLSNDQIKKGVSSWFGGSTSAAARGLAPQAPWTLWDSARVATESILELSLAMDRDHKIDVMLFPTTAAAYGYNATSFPVLESNSIAEIQNLFSTNSPGGSTPLAACLQNLRVQKLDALLAPLKSSSGALNGDNMPTPFTVVIMTDGVPDNEADVYKFFVDLVRDYRLDTTGREFIAAFSFVQMGDNAAAARFLADLDDNMASYYKRGGVGPVDIIDTKEDNFLFGTGKYEGQTWKGPFALLHDAIFD
jgi:hypothetical protein